MNIAEAFRRVRKPCSWCQRTMQTVAKIQHPLCHGCRAKRRNLLKGRTAMRGIKAAYQALNAGELR